jgi:hypothetical protein
MSRLIITSVIASLLVVAIPQDDSLKGIDVVFNEKTNVRTFRLRSMRISGPKDRYHSLAFSIYKDYPPGSPFPPDFVNFELVSVVKARTLNTDLYVVFVIDGKELHFSSNRRAIRRPVPGKPWIGEEMVFRIPYGDFLKMGAAKTLSVKLGGVAFDFDDEMLASLRRMTRLVSTSPTV